MKPKAREERSFRKPIAPRGPRIDRPDLSVDVEPTTPEVKIPRVPTVTTVQPVP